MRKSFKIGDRIRVLTTGETGIVTGPKVKGEYGVRVDGYLVQAGYRPEELEKI